MSTFDPTNTDHLQLMADAVTEGLSPQDQATLDRMLRDSGEARDEMERFELSAAAVDVALLANQVNESLPAGLRDQLIASATPYLSKPLADQDAASTPALKLTDTSARPDTATKPSPWNSPLALGWYFAAAAVIGLAFVLINPPTEVVEVEKVVEVEVPAPSIADQVDGRTNLAQAYAEMREKEGVVSAPWGYNDGSLGLAPGEERFANCSGEVVFDPETQTGYLKLAGLPVNKPEQEQYQLWIVDATRGEETTDRIDGGVFNVDRDGTVYIPVAAKITANQPALFALTMEAPGGVVVSKGPIHTVALVQ